jgi:hypothetical protein
LTGGRLSEGVEGIARFHEMVGAHSDEPEEVVIVIDTYRVVEAAYALCPIGLRQRAAVVLGPAGRPGSGAAPGERSAWRISAR